MKVKIETRYTAAKKYKNFISHETATWQISASAFAVIKLDGKISKKTFLELERWCHNSYAKATHTRSNKSRTFLTREEIFSAITTAFFDK